MIVTLGIISALVAGVLALYIVVRFFPTVDPNETEQEWLDRQW